VQLKALQELAAAEGAEAAASAEYETVSLRNEADMTGYIQAQAGEIRASLFAIVKVQQRHAAVEAEAWLAIAKSLGCSREHVAAIERL
jgi:NADH:ubiquinone oxidoreductase subunit E